MVKVMRVSVCLYTPSAESCTHDRTLSSGLSIHADSKSPRSRHRTARTQNAMHNVMHTTMLTHLVAQKPPCTALSSKHRTPNSRSAASWSIHHMLNTGSCALPHAWRLCDRHQSGNCAPACHVRSRASVGHTPLSFVMSFIGSEAEGRSRLRAAFASGPLKRVLNENHRSQ